MSAVAKIEQGLEALGTRFRDAFSAASSEVELRAEQAKVLGKKGELTQILSLLRDVPAESRPLVGAKVNVFKDAVEKAFAARLDAIQDQALEADLAGRRFDLTLPGRLPFRRGHAHPVLTVRDELVAIFRELGFVHVSAPEIELEENNFTKLAFPPDHPATDMQDSFWFEGDVLLRTHTSNVQVRSMVEHVRRAQEAGVAPGPLAVVSAGPVYRRDDDVTHSPMFHQFEAFLIGESVSMANLRGVIAAFAERLYGPGASIRFRPSYFPFVEPGAEVDVACVFCREDDGSRAVCRVCKSTGFLEIGGCGMIHPDVFRHVGLDPEKTTGFAFGMGIDRIAMLRYAIPNIRVLFENDPRFLAQF